jgi:hypothetical protein
MQRAVQLHQGRLTGQWRSNYSRDVQKSDLECSKCIHILGSTQSDLSLFPSYPRMDLSRPETPLFVQTVTWHRDGGMFHLNRTHGSEMEDISSSVTSLALWGYFESSVWCLVKGVATIGANLNPRQAWVAWANAQPQDLQCHTIGFSDPSNRLA